MKTEIKFKTDRDTELFLSVIKSYFSLTDLSPAEEIIFLLTCDADKFNEDLIRHIETLQDEELRESFGINASSEELGAMSMFLSILQLNS